MRQSALKGVMLEGNEFVILEVEVSHPGTDDRDNLIITSFLNIGPSDNHQGRPGSSDNHRSGDTQLAPLINGPHPSIAREQRLQTTVSSEHAALLTPHRCYSSPNPQNTRHKCKSLPKAPTRKPRAK